jgi:hypothetical protein
MENDKNMNETKKNCEDEEKSLTSAEKYNRIITAD